MALPNFFIIGAAKAGTTSLYRYLAQHPEVQMAAVKEPNHFSGDPGKFPYPQNQFVKSRRDYERLFDPTYVLRGEASVGYSNYPRRKGVPEAIHEAVPSAKFIYLVRDPVERVVSQYRYRVALEGERRPINEALGDPRDPTSVYICPSLYATQLERYLTVFDESQILVVDHLDLLHCREDALHRVLSFLGADPVLDGIDLTAQNTQKTNRRYPGSYLKLRRRLGGSALNRLLPSALRRSVRITFERSLFRSVPPAEPDAALRSRLEEVLAPEATGLRDLTGMPFSSWCV